MLSRSEREEFITAGKALARDMAIAKQPLKRVRTEHFSFADIQKIKHFLTQINALAKHPRKPFEPMQGDHFRL